MAKRINKKYGYSNTRVKAMESRLISQQAMHSIVDASNIEAALALLFQQQAYKDDIAKYGGTSMKRELVDFALSSNLARNVNKLVRIVPKPQKEAMRSLIGRWDIHNLRLALEAKDRGMGFEQIAPNIIETSVGSPQIKEAMREQTVESMLSRLAIGSPYSRIIKSASATYAKTKNAAEAIAVLDVGYYAGMSETIDEIAKVHPQSAAIVRMEMDSKNILTMIRGKRLGMKFSALEPYFITNGSMRIKELAQVYDSSHSVDDMVHKIGKFDLKASLDVYKKTGQMVSFEIGMNNYILNKGLSALRISVLSFGALLEYMYLKELEVRTLRIAINSKLYGLAAEDVNRLIAWRK